MCIMDSEFDDSTESGDIKGELFPDSFVVEDSFEANNSLESHKDESIVSSNVDPIKSKSDIIKNSSDDTLESHKNSFINIRNTTFYDSESDISDNESSVSNKKKNYSTSSNYYSTEKILDDYKVAVPKRKIKNIVYSESDSSNAESPNWKQNSDRSENASFNVKSVPKKQHSSRKSSDTKSLHLKPSGSDTDVQIMAVNRNKLKMIESNSEDDGEVFSPSTRYSITGHRPTGSDDDDVSIDSQSSLEPTDLSLKELDDSIKLIKESLPTQLNDSDIIDISSDDEKRTKSKYQKPFNKSVLLRQQTLHSVVKKMSSANKILNIQNDNDSSNTNAVYCTQKEYSEQARKVAELRTDLKRTKILQNSVQLNHLPDKGLSIKQRQLTLEKNLEKEEIYLNKMVVETEEHMDSKANVFVPWDKLQTGSEAVVPRTWGKQALATHTFQKSVTMDRLKDLHGSLANCPTEDILAEDPKHLKVELMPHQKRALAWLLWREGQKPSGGILADDMGLGKTLTMISLVLKSKEENHQDPESDSDSENRDDSWSKKGKQTFPDGGTLVVCPATLLKQWEGEVLKRCRRGLLGVELYHGTNRESKPQRLAKHEMVITTYNLAMRECAKKGPLYKVKWRRIILDEAHVVRNCKSQTSIAMCTLQGKSRWTLTGTPVHNKELDLFALLKFLRCSPFDDIHIWKRWVVNKNAGGQDRLNTVMRSIMLRRTKLQLQSEGALQNLPEKKFELIQVTLDKNEMKVYKKVMLFSRTLFAQFLHQRAEKNSDLLLNSQSSGPNFLKQNDPNSEYYKMHKKILKMHGTADVKSHEILVLLLRLRQICSHPSLIIGMLDGDNEIDGADDVIEDDGLDIDILDKLANLGLDEDTYDPNVAGTSVEPESFNKAASKLLSLSNPVFDKNRTNEKIRKALEIINVRVIPHNDKAIIVSQWTTMLRIVNLHFKEAGIHCEMLDGNVPIMKRNEMVENFNNPSHKIKVLLLSLTAGGVGLNLVGGNHLLLLDLHWNPQLESQAQDRIYRVGQKKPVIIYKLVTMDTIEQRIKALQDNKLQMATDILSGTKPGAGSKLSLDDLKMLFSA